jgi:hypothetical protein
MSDAVQELFDALVVRYGGDKHLGIAGCASVRAAAVILTDPGLNAKGAETAERLLASLPPPPPPTRSSAGGPHDMSVLSDRELDEFHRLLIKVTVRPGREPIEFPPPDPQLVGGRAETPREFACREFGRRLDVIEVEGVAVGAREASELGERFLDLLPTSGGKPLLRLDMLFPTAFRYAQHLQRERDAVPVAAVPAPVVDNVVELSEAEREKIAMKREAERLDALMTVNRDPGWPQ